MTDELSAPNPETSRLLVVTGLSGAGRSQCLKVLEDIGYYCVDNLPLPLLQDFLKLARAPERALSQVAIGLDVRGRVEPGAYAEAIHSLRRSGYPIEVMFLDASDQVLVSRFKESRRPHPLEQTGAIAELVERERLALSPLREVADFVLDTSSLNIHALRRKLNHLFAPEKVGASLKVTLLSFAYRHGVPFEADLVFDVRFLPNPYFVPELKELDGRSPAVSGYVMQHPLSQAFFERLTGMLDFLLPEYQREGKTYLTICVGCTGGQHRSVSIVEALRGWIEPRGVAFEVRHRDVPA